MNKVMLNDISELSDSRELLTERPHRFVSIFAYILIALLVSALIWAFVGEVDIYVRAHGEVRPNDAISTVRSTFSGRILETNIEDGMPVQRGDILFIINAQEHLDTLEILERQYAVVYTEVENLQLFRESVILGENLFDYNDPTQLDYYFRFQKYLTDIEVAIEQISNMNFDIDRFFTDARVTRDAAVTSRSRTSGELYALQRLLDSFDYGKNLVPNWNAEQYRRFIDFEINIDRHESVINLRGATAYRMEQLYEVGGVSRNERDAALLDYYSAITARDSYINQTQLLVLQNITGLEWNLSDFNSAIRGADSMLELSGAGFSEDLLRERHMLDTLTSISNELLSLQNNRYTLQMDIGSLRLTIEEAQVISPIDGVVSMFGELNVGDFVQTGMDIATILPVTDGEHRVMLLVSNADIAEVDVGHVIYFRFAALPVTDFGEMSGKVTRISTDAQINEGGQSYFVVEAEMDGGSLSDRNGVESTIRVGMVCDARVITRTQRIIFWVLERLNFVD